MEVYFRRWRKTDLARIVCQGKPETHKDVPLTSYSDYPMLKEFGMRIAGKMNANPKRRGELFRDYYDRITPDVGSALNRYMAEPFYFCMKSTGTTGENKWIANGETFWNNFASGSIAVALIACSDGWGETKLEVGDRAINVTAPIPYISGWGTWASHIHLELVPPIEIADNLRNMRETYTLLLKTIKRGVKISIGGGLGSMFYMICKYFVDPSEFYKEYYHSRNIGLEKILLSLKMFQLKLGRKKLKRIYILE